MDNAMIENEVNDKIAKVSDLLEQIERLNELINFQKSEQADASTIRQYEFMRQESVVALEQLLKEFKLVFPSIEIAA